nr:MAG TPA_asm: hypothetical protein [Caudoviricetes sp.]
MNNVSRETFNSLYNRHKKLVPVNKLLKLK